MSMQGTNAIPVGCPNWDNAKRNHGRKVYKFERAWYSRKYAHLPRKAKKKLMRQWREDGLYSFVPMSLAQNPICWESHPHWVLRQFKGPYPRGGHFSPLAPPEERKRQLRAYKRLQKHFMGRPVWDGNF